MEAVVRSPDYWPETRSINASTSTALTVWKPAGVRTSHSTGWLAWLSPDKASFVADAYCLVGGVSLAR